MLVKSLRKVFCVALAASMFVAGVPKNEGIAAAKPSLSDSELYVDEGSTEKITADDAKKYKVSWKSKKKSVATVKKSGKYAAKVKGVKPGKATIVCKLKKGKKKKQLKCSVTVKESMAKYGTPKDYIGIKDAYAGTIDTIGTCLSYSSPAQLTDAATMEHVKRHYNSFTMENEMKPEGILKQELIPVDQAKTMPDYVIPESYKESTVPTLKFENVDRALEIANANGLRMRAHTLVWHSQTPSWFFQKNYKGAAADVDTMNGRLELYIRSVMSHVLKKEKELTGEAGKIVYAWDVVNEYIHRMGATSWHTIYKDADAMRPTYVKKAFEIAYSVLKEYNVTDKVTLVFNDYNTYFESDKELAVINFINEGEPEKICSAIGMQSHVDVDTPSVEEYIAALNKFMAAGLEVQITELDMTINFDNEGGTYNYKEVGQTDADQAKYCGELMKAIVAAQRNRDKNVCPKGITSLTLWGLYDSISWRSTMKPLLFESLTQPKLSFMAFVAAPGEVAK